MNEACLHGYVFTTMRLVTYYCVIEYLNLLKILLYMQYWGNISSGISAATTSVSLTYHEEMFPRNCHYIVLASHEQLAVWICHNNSPSPKGS